MKRPPRTVVLAAALISGVAVAALILCTTLFLRSYRSAVVEGARTNSAQVVSQVAGAVDNYVNTMDSAVGIVLEQLDSEPAMRDAFLNAFLTARPEVAAITTYDESGSLLDCWAQAGRTPKSDILRNLSFDLTTARRLGHGYISTPHVESIFDSYYPWVVSVIRAVPEDGGSSRWLAVDLSFKELAATINNVSIGQHGYCYLMDERGNMVYHPQQQLLYAGLKKEEAGRLACLGDGTYVEDTVIYSVQRVPGSTWRVVGVSYIDETVNESFRQMVRITVITAGLVFLAALAAGWVLSRLLSRPLQQLETAMEQFEQDADHFAFQAVRGTREVQNLSDSFGHMVGRIQQLMTTVREEEIVLRKTELKALQAQINPHFLYNTLDSINWLAKDYHVEQISQLVTSLSTLLRTSLNNGQPELTVEQELTHMRSYLNIQKVRFCGLFQVHEEVDESLLQDTVIKMLLQPLVENAILHAFNRSDAPAEGNLLLVRVFARAGDLVLEVANNAPDDALAQVQQRLRQEAGAPARSYGIQSIRTRLEIAYAREAALEYRMEGGFLTPPLYRPRPPDYPQTEGVKTHALFRFDRGR